MLLLFKYPSSLLGDDHCRLPHQVKSLEIEQKFLNLQLPKLRAYIHRCSHSTVRMAECPRQKPDSQRLLQKLLKLPPPLRPSVFTCSAGYQKAIANLVSPEPNALPLPLFIHHSYGRGQCTIRPSAPHKSSYSPLHFILRLTARSIQSLPPYLQSMAWPRHLFHVHYCLHNSYHSWPPTHINKVPYCRCSLCPSSSTEAQRDWKFSKPLCNLQTPFPNSLPKAQPPSWISVLQKC